MWFKWWSDLFKDSFNYYYDYTYHMFNQDLRIGTDDDVIIMGDVTIVLPKNKAQGNAEEIKAEVLRAIRSKYKESPGLFKPSNPPAS